MEVINCYDERNRLVRVKFSNNGNNIQMDSHGYSYLGARDMYKQLGDVMGLEKDVTETIESGLALTN